ncbi:possible DNA polymerase delta subunit [Pseudozyma hubeiensis SY62]|uniref:DNA polymerase delta subunit 3 n=1 Tax=Pseudozyma hubeiensis (strain SY62) TaxID=1305764 RepID=R9P330_PSEHS|nr:possible DNA polymerase delta subunit [Pseudozyma hubeiensis SY62]GAC92510.1 possible DNA polymerase delta subunit [Pseudozyma hubeiensis SY62]
MAPSSDPTSFLTSCIQRDKKLVTYRLLSRELRIHVDEAKKALAAFYESHKDKSNLDATYILIGKAAFAEPQSDAAAAPKADEEQPEDGKPIGSSSTPSSSTVPARSFLDSRVTQRQTRTNVTRKVIRLVSAAHLDEAQSSFEQITSCHIYSISPGRLRDATQLTAVQHDLHTQQKYIDTWQQTNRGAELGVIVNPTIKDNYDPTKAIPSLGAPSAPALPASKDNKSANSSIASKVKTEPDAKTSSTTTATAKATPAAPPASASSKKSGLDWSRAKPKDSEPKPAPVKKEAPSSAKRSSTRKALLGSDDEDDDDDNSRRKPLLVDDDEDDEDDDKPEKLGYADDDDSDGDVKMSDPVPSAAPRGTGKRADARSQTKAQEAAQRKKLEAMMDDDDDNDNDVQVVEPSGVSSSATKTGQGKDLDPDVPMANSTVTDTMDGTQNAPKRRVRKKRKIGSKKVRTKDERGYTVTKTVDEYESYSSEESDAPVVVGSKRASGAAKKEAAEELAEARSTSTSASASPAPAAAAKSTPASNNSGGLRKPSGGATPAPAKKGQQSLNSFFTRKPK